MGKADEAGFSLVPYNEKEAAVQGWQYGGDDGDRVRSLVHVREACTHALPSKGHAAASVDQTRHLTVIARPEPALSPSHNL